MDNTGVKWGVYLGIASVALSLVFYLVNPKLIFTVSSYIGLLVTIVLLVLATKEERTNLGGFASFGQMFSPAFITFAIGSIISVAFTYILMNFIDPGLLDMQREISIEAIEKMSGLLGEEGVEAAVEEIENTNPMSLPKLGMGLAFSLVIGAIVSAIIAAIMKKTDPNAAF